MSALITEMSALISLIESPRILVTSVVSKRRHMLRKNYQNSLQLVVPVHIYVILSMGGWLGTKGRLCTIGLESAS